MKITYLKWGYSYDDAIIRAFESEGIQLEIISSFDYNLTKNTNREKVNEDYSDLKRLLETCNGDIIFTINFFADISDFCQQKAIPYCSWVLQLPNFELYQKAVYNPCNYIGICDSYLVEKMWRLGISKVFFLPDAVELGEKIKHEVEERECCFISNYKHKTLETINMSLYGKGYLDSFIHAQRVLYGANILENGLLNRVYKEFIGCNEIPSFIEPQFEKLYIADQYLAPVCTGMQQNIFLKNNEKIMTIYSDNSFEMCNSGKFPYVESETKRREIYAYKEFSIVLAPHVLHNGIPRDLLEVVAAGGFPICGYQKDYSYFFTRDENIAYFTNSAEFTQNIVKYGNNHSERERVRENAYKLVASAHTYHHRIINMLEMWEKL